MKLILTLIIPMFLMVGSSLTTMAQEVSDWKIEAGVVTLYKPVSPGINEYEWKAYPLIDVTYRDVYFLNFQKGLGMTVLGDRQSQHQLDLAVGVDFGRDESDAVQLNGLGDVDESIEFRAFYTFRFSETWSVSARFAHGLNSDGHNGTYVDLSANWSHFIPEQSFFIQVGPSLRLADENFLNSFYGVSNTQSLASGYSQYQAGSGIDSVAMNLFIRKGIHENWSVFGQARFSLLGSKAKDSPFVSEDAEVFLMSGVSFRF